MKSSAFFSILLCLFLFAVGCTDKTLPLLEGDMIGYVFTFDEFSNLLENHKNVTVTAVGDGTDFSANTDENGRFYLNNLPIGTYELWFEKEGYGTLKQFGVKHLGGQPTILGLNDDHVYFIYEMPTTVITNLVLNKDTAFAEFTFNKSPQPEYLTLTLYFSESADFAETALNYSWDFKFGVNRPNWHRWTTTYMPFTPGSTVYYKAAVNTNVTLVDKSENYLYLFSEFYYVLYGISTYFDIETKKTVYPNIGNETKVYSFVFPE